MEGFSKVDIFDTKGIEYIFVIGYLVVLIIFWRIASKHESIFVKIRKTVTDLAAGVLRIPQGLYFNPNHTWTYLQKSGTAMVGLDDFVRYVVGEVEVTGLKKPGDAIKKGDLLAEIARDGKKLSVFSPISGRILGANRELLENPGNIMEDPYDKGWIYKIKPDSWVRETKSYLVAEEAVQWAKGELDRFKEFLNRGPVQKYMTAQAMPVLQEGGEIKENLLGEFPDEVWKDFQKAFLNNSPG